LSILLVFLVLAAQYGKFPPALRRHPGRPHGPPFPPCLGLWLTRGENNVFTQIGLIVLIGLAAKTPS